MDDSNSGRTVTKKGCSVAGRYGCALVSYRSAVDVSVVPRSKSFPRFSDDKKITAR